MLNQYTRANSNFKTKYYTYLRTENYEVKNFEYFDDIDWHKEKENKLQFLNDKLSNLHEYDKLLFQLYYSTGKSIRKLSKESGISVTSIYNTLRNVKNYLKDEVESEYKELQ
jgi:DNA-directed RNA polymerase specialized sigma subunit